ncbi:hypothetical protein DPEC_G00294360 [Dallia pectoralis]|uniref:Uncharacterized protein n=1 Tax=Dallia pectoralis TaxID=75939 RepID=A0ACC2FIG5_DALPE|nr:hypothetical protein DPEC_G00294360 [Dallia pectoralis]
MLDRYDSTEGPRLGPLVSVSPGVAGRTCPRATPTSVRPRRFTAPNASIDIDLNTSPAAPRVRRDEEERKGQKEQGRMGAEGLMGSIGGRVGNACRQDEATSSPKIQAGELGTPQAQFTENTVFQLCVRLGPAYPLFSVTRQNAPR